MIRLIAMVLVAGTGLLVAIGGILLARAAVQARAARRDLHRAVEVGQVAPSLHPEIDPRRCIGAGACVTACPEERVLAVIDGQAQLVNPASCIGHGECLRACPVDAIALVLGAPDHPVHVPAVDGSFQTNVPGIYVAGELGGMALIVNAMNQGLQAAKAIAASAPPRTPGIHQLLVIGAGPAGLAATLQAMHDGLDVLTVDQDTIGGTVAHYPRRKLVMTRTVHLPGYGALRLGEIRKEDLLARWADVIDRTGLSVRTGVRIAAIRREGAAFRVESADGEVFRAHRILLALGRRGSPRRLGVPGEDLPKVAYRLEDPEAWSGARCLVVGGGDAAVEAAMALGAAGARVTLSYRRAAFGRIKAKNQERLDVAVAAGRVSLLLSSNVVAIHPDRVEIDVEGEVREIDNDAVFICAGGVLPTRMLEAAGIEVREYRGDVYAGAS